VAPKRITRAAEWMDEPDADRAQLEASLDDVATVNRMLGGTRAVLRGLDRLLHGRRQVSILDVGCGAADVPIAIVDRARSKGTDVRVVAADLHEGTLDVARRRTAGHPEIEVVRADARRLPFADRSFDCALLSLTLHHLDDDDQLTALRQLSRVCRAGIIVNELERTWANYAGARLLAATLWRRRPITRHDGPLSVLRAFTAAELRAIATEAGLRGAFVERRFFYRVLLLAGPDALGDPAHSR
jgi:SAM-dependent methyltransferase